MEENEKEIEELESNEDDDELEYASFSYVDENGTFHEAFGCYVPNPDGKTSDERIKEMQEIIKNAN